MNLTNIHNLPSPLVAALTRDTYFQDGHISVTGLIQPPRIRQLTKRYHDKITEDVTDRIWALIGSAVHSILELADTDNVLQEERLSVRVNGWKITGKADLWEEPSTLSDYKITSVWAGMNGVKSEWEQQGNLYALLYRAAGFPVNKVQIVAIYRDWSKNRAKAGNGYPRCQVETLPVKVWPHAKTEGFLDARVSIHQEAENLHDNELPWCTPEERWARPDTYAVMKKGRKRAMRVLDSEDAALEWMANNGGDAGVVRPGESVRCEGYCSVAPFCNQYQEMKNG